MELDELKRELAQTEPRYSQNELEGIFKVRTDRTIGNMKRIMQIDMVLMFSVAIIMIALTFILGLRDKYFISAEILLVASLLALHFSIKKKVIYKQLVDTDILNAINSVSKKIKGYKNAYKVLVPIIICSFYIKTILNLAQAFPLDSDMLWLLLTPLILLAYVSLKLTKWLIVKLYQPTITKLERLHDELS